MDLNKVTKEECRGVPLPQHLLGSVNNPNANFSANGDHRNKEKLVVIMGATGTGKSRLSIDLAKPFQPAEIINSDKMQVYQGLDITTNKVTKEECRGVPLPHHLLGSVNNPNANFSANDFGHHALPIIAGGSNSYIDALVDREGNTNQVHNKLFIHKLGRDITITCLLKLPRSDFGSIALLNQSFRSLIRGGELYRLRRKMGIVEHWIFFYNVLEWAALDPNRRRWMPLPRMTSNECFLCSDKAPLAVGTEVLVFGKEISAPAVYEYSFLTTSWRYGVQMNFPRYSFASASDGKIAIVAGGCDSGNDKVLSVAEMYNSETRKWESLPNMNKPRKKSTGFILNEKFYALGGIGEDKLQALTCGEEFDMKTRTWRVIADMVPSRRGEGEDDGVPIPESVEAPPLVTVVNNVLYGADYARQEVKKYVEDRNRWVAIGNLPQGINSMNGCGNLPVAFTGCGERLMVIGVKRPSVYGGGVVEIYSWIPDGGAPHWDLLYRRPSGSFVYDCTVMGC